MMGMRSMRMRRARCILGIVSVVLVAGATVAGVARAQAQALEPAPSMAMTQAPPPYAEGRYATDANVESRAGRWGGGSSAGVMFSTPDGTAFGVNGNAEYFLADNFSIGPLAQLGLTGDMVLIGVSGQGKYYIPLPGTPGRIAVQGGVGVAHADFRANDTSWLVPLGVEYDYALNSRLDLTATVLVNVTNLHTGGGSGADVMPGLAFGVHF